MFIEINGFFTASLHRVVGNKNDLELLLILSFIYLVMIVILLGLLMGVTSF